MAINGKLNLVVGVLALANSIALTHSMFEPAMVKIETPSGRTHVYSDRTEHITGDGNVVTIAHGPVAMPTVSGADITAAREDSSQMRQQQQQQQQQP